MDTEMSGHDAATTTGPTDTTAFDLEAIDEQLDAVVAPLEASYAVLLGRKKELAGQMSLLDDKIKKIERTLRTLKPERFSPAAMGGRTQNGNVGPRVNVTPPGGISVMRLAHWITQQDDEFSLTEVADHFGVSSDEAMGGIETLRSEELVRVVRPGVYRAMPDAEHVFARLFQDPDHGLARTPFLRHERGGQQQAAEERRDQIVKWMLENPGEQVTTARLVEALEAPHGRVGDDLRELVRRGVVRDMGEAPKPAGFVGRTGRLYDLA